MMMLEMTKEQAQTLLDVTQNYLDKLDREISTTLPTEEAKWLTHQRGVLTPMLRVFGGPGNGAKGGMAGPLQTDMVPLLIRVFTDATIDLVGEMTRVLADGYEAFADTLKAKVEHLADAVHQLRGAYSQMQREEAPFHPRAVQGVPSTEEVTIRMAACSGVSREHLTGTLKEEQDWQASLPPPVFRAPGNDTVH